MIDSLPRFKWSEDQLRSASLSEQTLRFLLESGLPEFVPGMTLEFGAFDSDSPDFVIGEDLESPIFVKSGGDEVWIEGRDNECDTFVNTSVVFLEQFIALILAEHQSGEPDSWANQITRELSKMDPLALASNRNCMWPHVIERFAVN